MKSVIKIFSFIGLALTLIPAFLVFQGIVDSGTNKILMLAGTFCWFLTAPYWMNKTSKTQSNEE